MQPAIIMATLEPANSKTNELVISPRDILFECPSCHKSLVVDEAAEGMIFECPQCHTSVIVPPKPVLAVPPGPPGAKPVPEATPAPAAEGEDVRGRLLTIASKLKELQTQRTEINNRLASRINDINRDLVMMARFETAHQQVLAELEQLLAQLGSQTAGKSANVRTRVNLRS